MYFALRDTDANLKLRKLREDALGIMVITFIFLLQPFVASHCECKTFALWVNVRTRRIFLRKIPRLPNIKDTRDTLILRTNRVARLNRKSTKTRRLIIAERLNAILENRVLNNGDVFCHWRRSTLIKPCHAAKVTKIERFPILLDCYEYG